jgi:hypothetical protein
MYWCHLCTSPGGMRSLFMCRRGLQKLDEPYKYKDDYDAIHLLQGWSYWIYMNLVLEVGVVPIFYGWSTTVHYMQGLQGRTLRRCN